MLVATVAFCAAIAAFNAVIDPTAQLGSGVLEPIAAGPRDRVAKVELLEAAGVPSLVILGSSRTKKLDPVDLGRGLPGDLSTMPHGVNAAVVGGDSFEQRVLAAWLVERAAAREVPVPQLVVGIDVEQFRDSSLQGSGFLDVPQLADVAREQAAGSDGSLGDELERVGRLLLTWQVTKASAASLRARMRGGSATAEDEGGGGSGGDGTQDRASFTDTGVPRADAAWFDADRAATFARRTPGLVERTLEELRATYESNGARLDADAVDDLRALVELVADADGPPPLLYVTPAHPKLVDELGELGRDARHDNVVDLLERLAASGDARVIDCTTCVDGANTSWIDATHPSPIGARQLAQRLRDSLASAPD